MAGVPGLLVFCRATEGAKRPNDEALDAVAAKVNETPKDAAERVQPVRESRSGKQEADAEVWRRGVPVTPGDAVKSQIRPDTAYLRLVESMNSFVSALPHGEAPTW